jgi:hypothetical protein
MLVSSKSVSITRRQKSRVRFIIYTSKEDTGHKSQSSVSLLLLTKRIRASYWVNSCIFKLEDSSSQVEEGTLLNKLSWKSYIFIHHMFKDGAQECLMGRKFSIIINKAILDHWKKSVWGFQILVGSCVFLWIFLHKTQQKFHGMLRII